MTATAEQKRRQQNAMRLAVRIIRTEHPDLWADAYRRARQTISKENPGR